MIIGETARYLTLPPAERTVESILNRIVKGQEQDGYTGTIQQSLVEWGNASFAEAFLKKADVTECIRVTERKDFFLIIFFGSDDESMLRRLMTESKINFSN